MRLRLASLVLLLAPLASAAEGHASLEAAAGWQAFARAQRAELALRFVAWLDEDGSGSVSVSELAAVAEPPLDQDTAKRLAGALRSASAPAGARASAVFAADFEAAFEMPTFPPSAHDVLAVVSARGAARKVAGAAAVAAPAPAPGALAAFAPNCTGSMLAFYFSRVRAAATGGSATEPRALGLAELVDVAASALGGAGADAGARAAVLSSPDVDRAGVPPGRIGAAGACAFLAKAVCPAELASGGGAARGAWGFPLATRDAAAGATHETALAALARGRPDADAAAGVPAAAAARALERLRLVPAPRAAALVRALDCDGRGELSRDALGLVVSIGFGELSTRGEEADRAVGGATAAAGGKEEAAGGATAAAAKGGKAKGGKAGGGAAGSHEL